MLMEIALAVHVLLTPVQPAPVVCGVEFPVEQPKTAVELALDNKLKAFYAIQRSA